MALVRDSVVFLPTSLYFTHGLYGTSGSFERNIVRAVLREVCFDDILYKVGVLAEMGKLYSSWAKIQPSINELRTF